MCASTEDYYGTVAMHCKRISYGIAPVLAPIVLLLSVYAGAPGPGRLNSGGDEMLHYALVFFLIAIVAAIFGFGGISVASAGIAKILFFIFLVIFLVSLVMGVARRA
jgi:uncharacterized membrane protein YtjA (UPF0391 family)